MQESTFIENNDHVLKILRSIDKFSPFSNHDLQAFLNLAKLKKCDPGEYLIQEGEFDCWIYFLLEGEVEILKKDKKVKSFSNPGDIFGEMCILDGEPRSASIRATQKSLLLGVDGSLMDRQKKADDLAFLYTTYRVFAEVLAERLRQTTEENRLLKEKLKDYETLRI